MKKSLLIVILFPFFYSNYIQAQTGIFYISEKELSSSLINAIYQDQRNYIWVATEDGLNKYDGVRFTQYKNILGNSKTIKSNYVKSLFEDNKGRFWVGCINGLHLYDRATDSFSEVSLYNKQLRVSPHITSIIESGSGEIWITTSEQGVIRIKENDETFNTDADLSSRLSSIHLSCIFQDQNGFFWIGSENQGLNRYDPITNQITIYKEPQIGSNQISAIREDKDGNLFVGTLSNGLYKLNQETKQFELVPHINRSTLSIKTLLLDNQGKLLIGTDGNGLKIYNPETQTLEDYQIMSAPLDLSKIKVHALCQDKTGNLWMGLFQKGVYLDPANPNKFNYWGMKLYNHNIIGSGAVMSILNDQEKQVWVGTDNDGIYRLNKEKNTSYHLSPSDKTNPVPTTTLTLVEDDFGNIWVGSYLQGLARINKKTGKCNYFNNHIGIPDDNSAKDKIFALAIDSDNKMWIGTNGAGVYTFDLKTLKYTAHYSQMNKGMYEIPNNWINCIMIDDDGLVWIGSYNGICSLAQNPDGYMITNNMLSGNVIYCIEKDSRGYFWIGTTEGLVRFKKKEQNIHKYTVSDGLASNVICGIIEDEDGNIWVSTHSGISKFVVSEEKFINYYASDGLQGNEFSLGAYFKADDGELFFGGITGVTSFYPREINDQRTPLNIFLTGLYVFGEPVISGKKSGKHEIINGFIADADTIRLSHNDHMFALEFSTFDFGFSERIYYQYMLEGLSSQWLRTEPGVNRINFTNISHGTYLLKIKASIYENTSEEKEIILIISPPWYLTGWAIIGYILLFLFLITGIVLFIRDKVRHRNELMKREHAEQISEAKLQFFINIAHEIRTPMSLVISPLEKLIEENKDAEKQKNYSLMHRNAQRILRLINQLMDVRKIDKGLMKVRLRETDMVGFIEDVMQTFEYLAKKQHIQFTFKHDMDHLKAWIDLNNFDKVLVNILSNAFKFTPENGEIEISLQTGKNPQVEGPLREYFEIIISDTGSGIEDDQIEKIFDRFYQIDNSGQGHNFGTGIGLNLSRSLVELQHGVIFAQNRRNKPGSEFVVRLPLGHAHLNESEKEESQLHTSVFPKRKIFSLEEFDQFENPEKPGTHPRTKYKVLIVDDEKDIRQYLKNELSKDYQIYEAENGKKALDFILATNPDLVISDVMMPEMDGFELCRQIKSTFETSHIPVILLTSLSDKSKQLEGLGLGADDYITKPFDVTLLGHRIKSIVKNREIIRDKALKLVKQPDEEEIILSNKLNDQFIKKALTVVQKNMDNSLFGKEEFASSMNVSGSLLYKKTKALTGQSPIDFIKTIRLNYSLELLQSKKYTVTEVSELCGFSSIGYFSTVFKKHFGKSPTEI